MMHIPAARLTMLCQGLHISIRHKIVYGSEENNQLIQYIALIRKYFGLVFCYRNKYYMLHLKIILYEDNLNPLSAKRYQDP